MRRGGVADSHGQGIGGVFGFDRLGASRDGADHQLYLMFFSAAVADDARFHGEGRVFADRQSGFGQHGKRNAAHVRELQRRFHILREEYFFDGGALWFMHNEELAKSDGNLCKASGERIFRAQRNDAVTDDGVASTIAIDDAPSGALRAAIDA